MSSASDRERVMSAYRALARVLQPGSYGPDDKTRAIEEEEARFRSVVESVEPPSIGQLKAQDSPSVSWDMADVEKWVPAIVRRMAEDCPDLGFAQRSSLTKEFLMEHFAPGVLIAEGVWLSLESQVDDAARVIAPAVIGKGCVITGEALIGPYSVVANHSVAGWVIRSSVGIRWA